jgi:hypothetical protein
LPGQLALVPLQTRGEHEGFWPGLPAGSTVQVPLAEAPSAAEQTSQPPEQRELQQRLSAQ